MPDSMIRGLWSAWEAVFHFLWKMKPIGSNGPYLFYVSKQRYLGYPFTVDGIQVNKYDAVIELHMNNDLILKILQEQRSAVGLAVKLLQEAKRSFPMLAQCVSSSEYDGINVLYGVTFINRAVERFGLHTFPIRRKMLAELSTWYLKKLLVMVNPEGTKLIEEHPDTFLPRVVAISRARLLELFPPVTQGETAESQASTAPATS
jgi:hypothetical protein